VRRRRRSGGQRHRHDGRVRLARAQARAVDARLEHDPEKWAPVFGKGHAQTENRMTAKLAVSALDKRFDALEALRAIDLAVAPGEFSALVGRGGGGKPTSRRIIAGLETATAGRVLIDGKPVTRPGGDRGFVFQTDNLLPWRTVLGNAMIGPEVAGRADEAARRRTLDLLKLVGLEGFESYHPRQLSGGMRQRVNLARALAIDPEILLMDEPFS